MRPWLGLMSALCFLVAYIPQLIRTYGTRNVEGVSTGYWGIVVTGYVTGMFYIVPFRDQFLLLTYSLGLGCAVAMLIGSLLFRK